MLLGKELKKTSHRGRPTRSQETLEKRFCFRCHKGNADQDYNFHVGNSSKDFEALSVGHGTGTVHTEIH